MKTYNPFHCRRRLGYFMFHTYIPTCLIVMMSWISFWIKPEAVPARVTLGVTSLLTLSTQHANSQKAEKVTIFLVLLNRNLPKKNNTIQRSFTIHSSINQSTKTKNLRRLLMGPSYFGAVNINNESSHKTSHPL